MADREVYYSDYLKLDKILGAQELESDKHQEHAHDEMLFIVVHQAYELWFKQVIFELDSIRDLLSQPRLNDNAPDLQVVVHRAERITTILNLLVDQIDVMETMTPLDFLDFRDMLRPASGFQSVQFKQLEAALGLKFEHRHGRDYYLSHLHKDDIDKVMNVEEGSSLAELVNEWLERIPFFDEDELWDGFDAPTEPSDMHPFWRSYREVYSNSLAEMEKGNLKNFDKYFFDPDFTADRRFSNKANRGVLFIMLYRNYPILQMPHRLIECLLEIDELLAIWRYRHMNMVHRIIGMRMGTGESTGRSYLKASLDKHYIFSELADLTSFLAPRRDLPQLPDKLEKRLGFSKV